MKLRPTSRQISGYGGLTSYFKNISQKLFSSRISAYHLQPNSSSTLISMTLPRLSSKGPIRFPVHSPQSLFPLTSSDSRVVHMNHHTPRFLFFFICAQLFILLRPSSSFFSAQTPDSAHFLFPSLCNSIDESVSTEHTPFLQFFS